MLKSLKKFSESEVAQERMRIITFFQTYGEKATKEAFGADRKVVSRWRQRLSQGGGRLESLVPSSTRPKHTRKSKVPREAIDFIKDLREQHPRLGKEKIKPLLDEYCQNHQVTTVSESTIGTIIKSHHFFFQKQGRIYHNPASRWAEKKQRKSKRCRIKRPINPSEFGHIVSDTIERITDGVKAYFFCAIDAKMKFALTIPYPKLTSRNNKDFYHRFQSVYPGIIRSWQSDNGKENLGEFEWQLTSDGIPHVFSYPHCPQINTYVERYNRTVQEEFIDHHLDIIHDQPLFCQALADWLIWYNSKRPHKSLGLKSPLNYFVEKGGMSQKSLTYTTS